MKDLLDMFSFNKRRILGNVGVKGRDSIDGIPMAKDKMRYVPIKISQYKNDIYRQWFGNHDEIDLSNEFKD